MIDDRSGATSLEYGLIAAIMTVAVIAAISLLGPQQSVLLKRATDFFNAP